jgi:N-hydroxyarylamine O-acetyltransferase
MADSTTDLDVPAYFARIGYAGPEPTDLEALADLHRAHILAVPFENLDIQLGRSIALDLASLQRKLVTDRRGGYCFEQNTYFEAVLRHFGWRVRSLGARVHNGSGQIPPRTHKLLCLETQAGPHLCDVGFGGRGFWTPLPWRDGAESRWGLDHCRLVKQDGIWQQQLARDDGWVTLYSFDESPLHPIDVTVANHYTSTHPDSHFVRNLVAIRRTATGRLIVFNGELRRETAGGVAVQPLDSPADLLQALSDHIGLRFDPAIRFRQPAFAGEITS